MSRSFHLLRIHEGHYFAFLRIRLVIRPELNTRWIFIRKSQLLTDDGQWTATNIFNVECRTLNSECRSKDS